MIESVGYTDDGEVWLTFSANMEGRMVKATMTIEPDNAVGASKSLFIAAEKAQQKRGPNVGTSTNTDKGGS